MQNYFEFFLYFVDFWQKCGILSSAGAGKCFRRPGGIYEQRERKMKIFAIMLFAGALAAFAAAVFTAFYCRTEKMEKIAALARERYAGALLGCAVLFWCVPHARAVAFDAVQGILIFLPPVIAVLSFFLADYLFARAFAGLLIVSAYSFIHGTYEFELPGAAVLTVFCWAAGIAGIIISGRPCLFRDLLRKVCVSRAWRIASALFWAVYGVILLASGVKICMI